MLPPHLAGFAFHPSPGAADAVAARADRLRGRGRVLVLGASHPTLLRRLVARGTPVVVVDSSRSTLLRARRTLPREVELQAEDPREIDPPPGVTVAVATATAWRAVLHAADRRRVLGSLDECVGPAGHILLELERVPRTEAGTCGTLSWRCDGDVVAVSCPDDPADLLLSAETVTALAAEVARARGGGNVRVLLPDGDDGAGPGASRVHVVATRTP